jgi:sugar/nucleoside kinase (ribokinase family)
MSLLVVGSIAFDDIQTPHGSIDNALGGSASFFSYVASFFTRARLVGVVGEDFPEENRRLLASRNIDTAGLVTQKGKTFRWKGRYHADMNGRDTLEVHLNVFEHFNPTLPEAFRDSTHVFLANSSPQTQVRVLDQIKKPQLVMADTMDLWIETAHDDLARLLPRIDGLLLNDSEARLLAGVDSLVEAGKKVLKMGPKFIILKKGEHGAMLFSEDGIGVMPAYPCEKVLDPTGAGDSFAGGILGYLAGEASSGNNDWKTRLRRAMAYGTVVASFTVEDFGLNRLKRLERREIDDRVERYRRMLTF